MRSSHLIQVVHAHAEGEVGDVVTGGVAPPPGDSLWDQARWLERDGFLRDFLLNEPRGGVFRHVNLLVPPKDPRAVMGFLIMEPEDTPPMSGSNTICVATVLVEAGIVPMQEPETRLTLQAPGGLVDVVITCRHGRAQAVRLTNLPSFVQRLDAVLEVEGLGTLTVDIAFGGDSFVLVDAGPLGFALAMSEARELAVLGRRIVDAANSQLGFTHPTLSGWKHISFCQFTRPPERIDGVLTGKSAVSIKPGKLDRSPTGTGCSARLAVMHKRGEIGEGETYVGLSPLGSRFHCRIERTTTLGGQPAIIPSIQGRAWITGTSQLMLDPEDPWPRGYRASDTWPSGPHSANVLG